MRRVGLTQGGAIFALLSALLVALSGCYAGAVGIGLGISKALKKPDLKTVNLPPAAPVIQSVTRLPAGRVAIAFSVLDDDGGKLDVAVSWRPATAPEASPFLKADLVPTPDATPIADGVVVEPNTPRTLRAIWDARAALIAIGIGAVAAVNFQVVASEEIGSSDPGEAGPIVVGNEPPSVVSLTPRAATGVVPLRILIQDSTEDAVTLDVRFRIGAQGASSPIQHAAAEQRDARFPTTLTGAGDGVTVFWDTTREVGLSESASTEVFVTVTPRDDYDPDASKPFEKGPITIDNNSEPSVEIFDIASSQDHSFEVPIRILVRDTESQRATVLLQWAMENEPFPEIPVLGLQNPSAGDLAFLSSLVANPPDFLLVEPVSGETRSAGEFRSRYRILTESAAVRRGRIQPSQVGNDLSRVRLPEMVRDGLVFFPEDVAGPTERPDPPWTRENARDLYLFRQTIRLHPWPRESAPAGEGEVVRAFASFDPVTSTATFTEALPGPLPAGTRFEIAAREGVVDLATSPAGVVHSVIWDSYRDLDGAGRSPQGGVRVRAIGIDSQVGAPSLESFFQLESGLLAESKTLSKSKGLTGTAIADLNGDGRSDAVFSRYTRETAHAFLRDEQGNFEEIPLDIPTGGDFQAVAAGDFDSDGLDDVVFASDITNRLSVIRQVRGQPFGQGPRQELSFQRPLGVVVGDLDGDSRDDCVAFSRLRSLVGLFLQRNDGTVGRDDGSPQLLLTASTGPQALAIGDLNGDGRVDIAVSCWDLNVTDRINVFYQSDRFSWPAQPDQDFTVGRQPSAAVIADFTGDGRADLVVANKNSSSVSLYQQDGLGSLARTPRTLIAGNGPVALTPVDVNGDLGNDLVVLNTFSNTVGVYLQRADGTLPDYPSFSTAPGEIDNSPLALAVGDLNDDLRPDLLVASSQGVRANGAVIYQRPAGAIPSLPNLKLSDVGFPLTVAMGDVNADGRSDVVVASRNSQSLGVYLQPPWGGVFARPNLEIPISIDNPQAGGGDVQRVDVVAIGDLNGDGASDLAVASLLQNRLTILYQRSGPAPFDPGTADVFATGDGPKSVAIGDLDSDGRNDVATANSVDSTLSVFFSRGAQRWDRFDMETDSVPTILRIRDLDGDGREDLLALNATQPFRVRIFFQGLPSASFPASVRIVEAGEFPRDVAIGDLDGDGLNDFVIADSLKRIYRQGPAGVFTPLPGNLVTQDGLTRMVLVGDMSGDGRDDVLLGNHNVNKMHLYFQDEAGRLGISRPPDNSVRSNGILTLDFVALAGDVGDLNGDGRNDVMIAVPTGSSLNLFLAR